MLRTIQFKCPNGGTLYQVVKGEAGPETDNRQITCRACGAPFVGHPSCLISGIQPRPAGGCFAGRGRHGSSVGRRNYLEEAETKT